MRVRRGVWLSCIWIGGAREGPESIPGILEIGIEVSHRVRFG